MFQTHPALRTCAVLCKSGMNTCLRDKPRGPHVHFSENILSILLDSSGFPYFPCSTATTETNRSMFRLGVPDVPGDPKVPTWHESCWRLHHHEHKVAALNPEDPMLTMAQDDFHKANWVSSPKFTTPKMIKIAGIYKC